jgi:aminoglycoside phosphotransferase (APT) family kinase protein
VSKHEAGYSNETFYITRGSQHWVMRRPPRGELLPTAHDVLREYRVLSGLVGTAARIPRPVVPCDDAAVIGAPFYLMERVDGVIIREDLPEVFEAEAERRRIGEEMIDGLVELHSVDWHTPGLESLGRPSGYLERQVRRGAGQLDLTLPRTRPLAGIGEVTDWLKANVPEQAETTVVQGDYKPDNVCFAATAPARLLAIFDWEMATLGDPLTDLGWLMAYWGDTGEPPEQMLPGNNTVTMLPGFLTREEMVALYEERSRRSMRHFPFYYTLALWKLTIIIEGLYMHYLEGTAANARAAEFEWRVPLMIERMHRSMAGA